MMCLTSCALLLLEMVPLQVCLLLCLMVGLVFLSSSLVDG